MSRPRFVEIGLIVDVARGNRLPCKLRKSLDPVAKPGVPAPGNGDYVRPRANPIALPTLSRIATPPQLDPPPEILGARMRLDSKNNAGSTGDGVAKSTSRAKIVIIGPRQHNGNRRPQPEHALPMTKFPYCRQKR